MSDLQNYKTLNVYCFKALCLWEFVTAAIGNQTVGLNLGSLMGCTGVLQKFTPCASLTSSHSPLVSICASKRAKTRGVPNTFSSLSYLSASVRGLPPSEMPPMPFPSLRCEHFLLLIQGGPKHLIFWDGVTEFPDRLGYPFLDIV